MMGIKITIKIMNPSLTNLGLFNWVERLPHQVTILGMMDMAKKMSQHIFVTRWQPGQLAVGLTMGRGGMNHA
jgi:hypothetical protein